MNHVESGVLDGATGKEGQPDEEEESLNACLSGCATEENE
jgi:hypothetical protein